MALGYTVAGLLWIGLSDRLSDALAGGSTQLLLLVSTSKGAFYVIVTGVLLYKLLQRWVERTEAAHAAALDAEREFRKLFHEAPLPGLVFSLPDLDVLEVNAAAIARYGYSHSEFLKLNARDLRRPEDVPLFERAAGALDQATRTTESLGEWNHVTKSGERIVVHLTWRNVVHQGRAARLVFATDLISQRQAERTLAESERTFAEMLGALTEAIWISDAAFTRFHFVSAAAEVICGLPLEEFREDTSVWLRLVHPDDLPGVEAQIAEGLVSRESRSHTFRIRRPDGQERWIEASVSPVLNASDEIVRRIGILADITQRRQLELELELAAHVFDDSRESIVITDAQRRILRANRSFEQMTGFSEAELIGQTPRILQSGLHDDAFYATMTATLAREGHWEGSIWDRRKNGETFPARLSITRVHDSAGRVSHYIGVSADITESRRAEARIHSLANFDPVTGLANRTLFESRIAERIAEGQTQGLTVILMGLDRFTAINQSLGHAAGDLVLVELAEMLGTVLPPGAGLARFSGDRFAILLSGEVDNENLHRVAHELASCVRGSASAADAPFPLTAGVGVARYPLDGTSVTELLRSAEAALNHAKGRGHGQVSFFSATLDAEASDRLRIEARLRRALDENLLELHYQPQITLAVGRCTAVEALARWTDPVLGVVPPGKFIPIAEGSTLILHLGDWVLGEACRQGRRWLDAGHPLVVAVNISAVQFRQPDFVDGVRRAIQAAGIPPNLLELEVTESVVMDGANAVTDTLGKLRALGVRLSIDDFGTGYSSLAYLRRFPIDKLKIDQSFVREMLHDPDAAAITQAVVDLAKSLRLQVIAEGVETEEQARFLTTIGCDEAQGWLYAKALPTPELEAWLKNRVDAAVPGVCTPVAPTPESSGFLGR